MTKEKLKKLHDAIMKKMNDSIRRRKHSKASYKSRFERKAGDPF